MKCISRNFFEFLIASLSLYFAIPIIVDQWVARFSRIANQKMNQLINAVADGKNHRFIENLFSEVSSGKSTHYRPVSVSVPPGANSNDIVKAASDYLYTPYQYGGLTKNGIDCSGLALRSYTAAGIQLPRSAELQYSTGTLINRMEDLELGDLVFFATGWGRKPTHVGIYVGDMKMIHASSK